MKLWEKGQKINDQVFDFTVGDDYITDLHLVKYDCMASIAHAKMLGKINILKNGEVEKLIDGLNEIINLVEKNNFEILKEHEDCHTAIENYLTDKLGELGKKIHTARSRNDQVLTALRLYYRDQGKEILSLMENLKKSISAFVKKTGDVKIPGYTHMQKAMPSSIELWGNAFVDSMEDNKRLLNAVLEIIDQSPLGTAAGYGVPLEIDRNFTAKELGFSRIQENSIYTQNSRGKFESSLLHALSQIMFDLNKIATDLILFSMPEFGFFELPVDFCTGSSIMPQKKNPDVLELMRAKYHVVSACEFQLKNIISNLIGGYNRDLQLTKEPVIKACSITRESLAIGVVLFDHLFINKDKCLAAMSNELYATEKVYELVKQGVPFRDAYQQIASKML
jgi:argininosuccinate lyase